MSQDQQAGDKLGLIEISGTTYFARPLRRDDYIALVRQARKTLPDPLAGLAEKLRGLPPALADRVVKEAVALSAGGGADPTEGYFAGWLGTPAGCAWLLHLAIRGQHPAMTLDRCKTLIPDDATAGDVLERLQPVLVKAAEAGTGGGRG